TSDIEEAVKSAEVIMLTIPGFAIETMAKDLAPVVDENQVILLNGAGAMGTLRFVNEMKTLGINKKLKIGETNSLTYGTRAVPETAKDELGLREKKLYFSAYPPENTAALKKISRQLQYHVCPTINS